MGYDQILLVPNGSRPEIFNVRRFAAAGDGVTDDTAAIQAAIDALPARGGAVYVPPGRYLVSSTIQLRRGVYLCGSTIGAQIGSAWYGSTIYLADNSNCDVMEYCPTDHGPSFIKVENLLIEGNKSHQTKGHGFVTRSLGESIMDMNLQHVWVFNCKEDGFHITNKTYQYHIAGFSSAAQTITISGNVASAFASGAGVTVTGTTANNGAKTLASDATYDSGTGLTTLTITGAITDETAVGKVGLTRTGVVGAWGIVLTECLSETNTGHGLFLHGEQCYVNGGFYAYSTGSQIYSPDPGYEIIMRGVNCRNAGSAASSHIMEFKNPIRCVTANCVVHNQGSSAVCGIRTSGYGNVFADNVIRDSASGTYGLEFTYATQSVARGNVFSGWGTANIRCSNGSGNVDMKLEVSGNVFVDGTAFSGRMSGMSLNNFATGFPSGADQAAAGVLAGNLWCDTDDNIIKMGV